MIPENAVVVAGSRAISDGPGKDWNLSLYTPVIVKYRDPLGEAQQNAVCGRCSDWCDQDCSRRRR